MVLAASCPLVVLPTVTVATGVRHADKLIEMASASLSALSSRVARPTTATRPRCVTHAYPYALLPSPAVSGRATPVSLRIYPHGARRAGTLTRSPPSDVARDAVFVTTNLLSPRTLTSGTSTLDHRQPFDIPAACPLDVRRWCIGTGRYRDKWSIP